ncbi:MAG TPA: hypothetical protein PLC05_03490, partial [bacterium]|nr:hypothetical protein [bacterium]
STGSVTGPGRLIISASDISQMDGVIDVATMNIYRVSDADPIVPATFDSPTVEITNAIDTTSRTWSPAAGTYTFNGNVTISGNISPSGGTFTIDNSVNNPNFVFNKNVTFTNGTNTLNWQKGTGTITVGGTSTQSLNFANKSVEDIDITNTSNTVSITNDITCNSLSASDNASIAVTAGKTITTSDISNIGGSASKLVTLRSSTTGSQWYLNVSGTPVVSYVDVRDSNASGGSIIYAGETSVDSGRNTNWLFTYSYSLLSDTSSINAGSSVDFTITIKDGYNENTIPNINGVRTLIFSGANPSPSGHAPTAKDKDGNVVKFGKPTPVNFIDSVATTTLTFYCSEETSIFVTDAEPSKPNPTALTVLAPSGSLVLSAKNTTTPLDGATYLSSPDVFLNLSLSNVNTPSSAKYRVSENQSNLNASLWQPYTDSAPYSLSQQDGYVTLYIVYQDEYGNNSFIYA